MIAPHPQRCETCMRRIGLIDGSDDCPIGVPYHTDVAEAYMIDEIGCASHSSQQSGRYRPVCYPDCENEKHIRKEERDKVLEEVIDRLTFCNGAGVDEKGQPLILLREALVTVDIFKRELRQQGKDGEQG